MMVKDETELVEFFYNYFHNNVKDTLLKHFNEITKVDYTHGNLNLHEFLTMTFDFSYSLLKYATPKEITNLAELIIDHVLDAFYHDCHMKSNEDIKKYREIYKIHFGNPQDKFWAIFRNLKELLRVFVQEIQSNEKFMKFIQKAYPNEYQDRKNVVARYEKWEDESYEKYKGMIEFEHESLTPESSDKLRDKNATPERVAGFKKLLMEAIRSKEVQTYMKGLHNVLLTGFLEVHTNEFSKKELIDSMLKEGSDKVDLRMLNWELNWITKYMEEYWFCGCSNKGEVSTGLIVFVAFLVVGIVTVLVVLLVRRRNRNAGHGLYSKHTEELSILPEP